MKIRAIKAGIWDNIWQTPGNMFFRYKAKAKPWLDSHQFDFVRFRRLNPPILHRSRGREVESTFGPLK